MWQGLLCCTRWIGLLSLRTKPYCKTIHMKAAEHYFHVTLFLALSKVVVTFGKTLELECFQTKV